MYTITNKGRKITNSKIKINHASFDKPEKKFIPKNHNEFESTKEIKKKNQTNPNKIFEGLKIDNKQKKDNKKKK